MLWSEMQFSKELWRFILSSYQLEKKVGINWNAIICKYLCTFLQIKCHILSNVICKCFEQYIIPVCAKHCGSLLISFVKFKTYFCHHWMIELDDDLRLFLTSFYEYLLGEKFHNKLTIEFFGLFIGGHCNVKHRWSRWSPNWLMRKLSTQNRFSS